MLYSDRYAIAALATLILLQIVMLTALYAGIGPHPPAAIPLFGIAPFIGASVSIALSAIILGPLANFAGRALSLLAALAALVSFGPQKYLDAQFGLIWPAVVVGQFAALVLVIQLVRAVGQREKGLAATTDMEQA